MVQRNRALAVRASRHPGAVRARAPGEGRANAHVEPSGETPLHRGEPHLGSRHAAARQRLRDDAQNAGASIEWQVTDVDVRLESGRPVEVTATTPDGPFSAAAALFVDASGREGVVRGAVPLLSRTCPPAGPSDLCSAQAAHLRGGRSFVRPSLSRGVRCRTRRRGQLDGTLGRVLRGGRPGRGVTR